MPRKWPDESSEDYVPTLKREYEGLLDEQSNAQSLNDQFKAMEARFQQRIDDRIGDLQDTLKNVMSGTTGGQSKPGSTPSFHFRSSTRQGLPEVNLLIG